MASANAGTFTVFGPQNYTRSTGAPVTVTSNFSVLNPNIQYTLKAFNGGLQDAQTELVSSGFVTVNGVQVLGPSNFNQNVSEVDVPVTLLGTNTIDVQVRGKPGGLLTVEIVGVDNDPAVISITSPANGATVSTSSVSVTGNVTDALSGVATVTCNGAPAIVQASSFSCSVALTSGANTITVSATDVAGNTSSASETVTFSNAAAPTITSFSPTSGPIGTEITLTGSNFTASGTVTPQITLSQQGGGSIVAPVASFTDTSISFVIPTGAISGVVTVTANGQSATSTVNLSVVASSNFTVVAGPSSASVQQGTSTAYSVTLSSNNGFSQLASLSVTGVPTGVSTKFTPSQITAGQSSILTVTAPAGQAVGNASLTISASATVDGIPTTQSASVSLAVQTATTSLIGRTVESDSNETSISGIVITMLGVDDAGNATGCSGQTRSDAAGNFTFTNLGTSCLGRQLVGFDGNSATDGEKYAGINLAYTLVAGQVTGPELVHMPDISDAETIMVQQNASVDQTFSYSTIPGVTVTVYAGTTLTMPDGTQPNPFPMAAVLVPVDRLPDAPSPTAGTLRASIVAFQPANTTSSLPVSVTFPNIVNNPPGVNMELDTLDPIVGELVKYGTGTVSADASEIVPDPDPAHPGHRFGISHFDWHGPMAPAPNGNNPSPDPNAPKNGDPVDTATGLLNFTKTDIAFGGARGQVAIQRTYRTLSGTAGPFGVGTNHNYGYLLDTSNIIRGTGTFVNLVMPDGNQFQFVQQGTNTFVNSTVPSMLGAIITSSSTTTYNLRWKNGTVFRFDTSSQGVLLAFLSSITDANGNTTTLVRGNPAQPLQITQIIDPVGRALNLTYDNFNRILSITDPIGRTVQYAYNPQGTLATVTDAGKGITTYTYDPQNRMSSITDARGITFLQNTYDANGRVIQQKAADGGITTFSYTLLNPTSATSPVLLTSVTDPLGNTTTYHFNPQGFLLDKTDPLGEKTVYTLDPQSNQPSSVTDPLGRVTTITYNINGNMISNTRMAGTPSAVTTSFTYDPIFNRLTSSTDGLGNTTTRSYDTAGNLVSITDPLGHKWTFQHDANGELTGVSDPVGNTATYAYTNGFVTSITDPLGNKSLQTFDAVGRMTSSTSALGQTTQYSYTPLNLVQQITDPSGGITSFVYDQNGNKLSMTDARGHATNYVYDNMDRLLSRTDALQRQESYVHDLNGNLLNVTDRKGQVTVFSYDVLNRPAFTGFKATNPGSNPSFESTISYTYDVASRVTRAVDSAGGTITDIYDNLDRLVNETTPQGSISYTYDTAGRETSMQVAGQPTISYTYDNASRTTQISQPNFNVNFNYDSANRRISATMSNGVAVSYAYDNDSRLADLTYQSGGLLLGNLTYAYNELGQRIRVGGSFARTSLSPAIASATYDATNQQTNWNGLVLSYDTNGNLLSDGTNTFTWNARNQLATVNNVTLQYDAFGRRTRNAMGTSFLYDGSNPVQELSGATTTTNFLTGGIDEIFSLTGSSGSFTPLRDALGSTIALVDSSGTVQTSYTYDPFGNTSISGPVNGNDFQYAGRENEGNGLYYLRARYYSPVLLRFINEDPLGFTGSGSNLYRYAYNNPISMTDPFGLSGGGGGGGGGSGLAGRKNDCNCNLDIDAFVQQMDDQAEDSSQGQCAKYVRMGLDVGLGGEASDENDLGSPVPAKDWGQWLIDNQGFTNVTDEWNGQPGYGANVGDIAVFQPDNGSNKNGHIEVWDGTQWVSDYKQGAPVESGKYEGAHFFPNLGKYGRQPYQIYRYNCKCN
ncbi:MAG TPA: RHS repeat-associated core domain-containing protein [Candidatus Angelobacter sp.]|nr:RHS repeat-associated core domain-containing protein [Candidatus Angelobacter sp.]